MQTGMLSVNNVLDINLSHVWYVDITWTGNDPTNVRMYFTAADYVDLTGEDAKNYMRLRQYMPQLRNAVKG